MGKRCGRLCGRRALSWHESSSDEREEFGRHIGTPTHRSRTRTLRLAPTPASQRLSTSPTLSPGRFGRGNGSQAETGFGFGGGGIDGGRGGVGIASKAGSIVSGVGDKTETSNGLTPDSADARAFLFEDANDAQADGGRGDWGEKEREREMERERDGLSPERTPAAAAIWGLGALANARAYYRYRSLIIDVDEERNWSEAMSSALLYGDPLAANVANRNSTLAEGSPRDDLAQGTDVMAGDDIAEDAGVPMKPIYEVEGVEGVDGPAEREGRRGSSGNSPRARVGVRSRARARARARTLNWRGERGRRAQMRTEDLGTGIRRGVPDRLKPFVLLAAFSTDAFLEKNEDYKNTVYKRVYGAKFPDDLASHLPPFTLGFSGPERDLHKKVVRARTRAQAARTQTFSAQRVAEPLHRIKEFLVTPLRGSRKGSNAGLEASLAEASPAENSSPLPDDSGFDELQTGQADEGAAALDFGMTDSELRRHHRSAIIRSNLSFSQSISFAQSIRTPSHTSSRTHTVTHPHTQSLHPYHALQGDVDGMAIHPIDENGTVGSIAEAMAVNGEIYGRRASRSVNDLGPVVTKPMRSLSGVQEEPIPTSAFGLTMNLNIPLTNPHTPSHPHTLTQPHTHAPGRRSYVNELGRLSTTEMEPGGLSAQRSQQSLALTSPYHSHDGAVSSDMAGLRGGPEGGRLSMHRVSSHVLAQFHSQAWREGEHKLERVTDVAAILTDEGRAAAARILWAIRREFMQIEFAPILPPLICVLLLYLTEEEALALTCLILQRSCALLADVGAARIFMTLRRSEFVRFVNQAEDLVKRHMRQLAAHLANYKVDLAMWLARNLQDGFASLLPFDLVLRIFFCFIYEGNKILLRYALALLKIEEEDLLACESSDEILNVLMCKDYRQPEPGLYNELSKVAFRLRIRTAHAPMNKYSSHDVPTPYLRSTKLSLLYRPRLDQPSRIFLDSHWVILWDRIPHHMKILDPYLVYASYRDGTSHAAFNRVMFNSPEAPTILLIRTACLAILGFFSPLALLGFWVPGTHAYMANKSAANVSTHKHTQTHTPASTHMLPPSPGPIIGTGPLSRSALRSTPRGPTPSVSGALTPRDSPLQDFSALTLFQISPNTLFFPWTGKSTAAPLRHTHERLLLASDPPALAIEKDFVRGLSQPSPAFNSPVLVQDKSGDFTINSIEVWVLE